MDAPKTLREAILFFDDAENCRKFMIAVRWEDGVVRCPICDSDAVIYLENAKLYYCRAKHPKQKFSLKVGTIFEDSAISLAKWLPAYWLLANCKNGISSYELARAIGVTQKSAWFMLHRIRYSLNQSADSKFEGGGPIEVDESYHGGAPKNRHLSKREQNPKFVMDDNGQKIKNPDYKSKAGHGTDKTPVFGMLDRETREVRAHVIPQIRRDVLMDAILANVEKGSKIYSDQLVAYKSLPAMDFVHKTVNHLYEYVRGDVHTNGIENFWSLLKRTLKGTYVAVEPFHLDQYVAEQVFRFNNRKDKDDYDRFMIAVSQATGKRLTHAELTGKAEERPF
jgi:transposase-like protein